jgi:hypothetical protein
MLVPTAFAFLCVKNRIAWGEVLRRAACIHAASAQEHGKLGFRSEYPIGIVPKGIDLPAVRSISCTTISRIVS